MSTDVLTRSFDNSRSGANITETVLTPAAVQAQGVEILLTLNTPDDPRLEAQPLYVSGLAFGAQTRNVIYQATMGNTIYAWDADTGEQLWSTLVGTPIKGSSAIVIQNGKPVNQIDMYNINVDWGIMSTPVIDRASETLYACAWISSDNSGKWQTGQHFAVAIDLVTGAFKAGKPMINLEGVVFDPGHGYPVITFKGVERKQRAGLALANGVLIICFGTIQETAKTAKGWVIAVDTAAWAVTAQWCSTGRGSGGGIWMSGSAPAIQSDGSIWFTTGNGDFDGVVDFGESVVRLRYAPPSGKTAGSLTVAGWWTPWTDDGRLNKNPEGEDMTKANKRASKNLPTASNFRADQHFARLKMAGMAMGGDYDWGDQDVGASGLVLVESAGLVLVSGKDGILYTVDIATPGDTAPTDLSAAATPANYAKLAAAPILYTYYSPLINPAAPNPYALNQNIFNVTHHLHGSMLFWQSAANGPMHFCGGENGNLRAWSLGADNVSTYLGCSAAYASPTAQVPLGGMPGWSIALSANGSTDGIVWASIPEGDANMALTDGRFLAYDAANLAKYADGSGELVPLWDSQTWNWQYLHPKFNRAIVADGKVIVPTYDGRVLVLGLA